MMKEKPIIFNGEMVKVLLDGRKTQTRRVVKPQPKGEIVWHAAPNNDIMPFSQEQHKYGTERMLICPYGKIGDRLWVRETHAFCPDDFKDTKGVIYRADNKYNDYVMPGEWCPSIHMPRWASRIDLEITDIRVERVQDISEEDAKAEGVAPLFTKDDIHNPRYRYEFDLDPMPYKNYLWHGHIDRTITAKQSDSWKHQYSSYDTAKDSFSSLWEAINAERGLGWDKSPWIWVVEFKVIGRSV